MAKLKVHYSPHRILGFEQHVLCGLTTNGETAYGPWWELVTCKACLRKRPNTMPIEKGESK